MDFKESKNNRDRILNLVKTKRDLSQIDWKQKEKRIKVFRDEQDEKIKSLRSYKDDSS